MELWTHKIDDVCNFSKMEHEIDWQIDAVLHCSSIYTSTVSQEVRSSILFRLPHHHPEGQGEREVSQTFRWTVQQNHCSLLGLLRRLMRMPLEVLEVFWARPIRMRPKGYTHAIQPDNLDLNMSKDITGQTGVWLLDADSKQNGWTEWMEKHERFISSSRGLDAAETPFSVVAQFCDLC